MQNSRIFLLAKTSILVYALGNDQAADMLQDNIILLQTLELIDKEAVDEALQYIVEGKKHNSADFSFKPTKEDINDTVQALKKLAKVCTVETTSKSLLEAAEFIDDFWRES